MAAEITILFGNEKRDRCVGRLKCWKVEKLRAEERIDNSRVFCMLDKI
jgi:hypothetical protein